MSRACDTDTLELLAREREVRIVTTRPDDSTVTTIIWVVVDADGTFVRSWRGERAHWYQAAVDRPTEVELIVRRRRIPVRVVLATDDGSVARCSSALLAKYAGDPAAKAMVSPAILGTTLRLEPR
jgi:hypothetical protein